MTKTLAKKKLVKDFTLLDQTKTIDQALEQLRQEKKRYGVVTGPEVDLPMLVTGKMLAQVQNKQSRLGDLAQSLPRPTAVRPDESLEEVASLLATNFVKDTNLAGLVVRDKQQVVGIVPRQALAHVVARLLERGGDTGRLEGASAVTGILFHCPQDGEEKLVSYYSPANPPRCSKGHRMIRKPRSSS